MRDVLLRLIGREWISTEPVATSDIVDSMLNICHRVYVWKALSDLTKAGLLIREFDPCNASRSQYRLARHLVAQKAVDSKAVGSTQSEGAAE